MIKSDNSKFRDYMWILIVLIASRLVLAFIGLVSRHFLHPGGHFLSDLIAIWAQWDAGWYFDIAQNGYKYNPHYNPLFAGQENYAFFPLYPLLMNLLSYIVHDYTIAGIIISNVFLYIACVFLYKIYKEFFGEKHPLEIVLILIIFPASFLFSCVLTESLYFSMILICFYYAKKEKWLVVGIVGFFVALTRNIGVFLIIPLILEHLKNNKYKILEIKYSILYLLFIPAGFMVWGLYLYSQTGDFLMFKNIQHTWGRVSSEPFSVLYNALISRDFSELFLAMYSIGLIVLICFKYKNIPIPYLVYCAYSLFIPLSTSVTSMIRYSIVVFPIYLLIRDYMKNEIARNLLLYTMAVIQGLFFVFWSSGYPLIF